VTRRLEFVQANNLLAWEETFLTKLSMFRWFRGLVICYLLGQVVIRISFDFILQEYVAGDILCTVIEFATWLGLCAVFRPRRQAMYFNLMQQTPETQMQILPMYRSEAMPSDYNEACKEMSPTAPVVILNPNDYYYDRSISKDLSDTDRHTDVMIGTPSNLPPNVGVQKTPSWSISRLWSRMTCQECRPASNAPSVSQSWGADPPDETRLLSTSPVSDDHGV